MEPIFVSQNFKSLKNMSVKDRWRLAGKIALYFFGVASLFTVGLFIFFAKDLPSPTTVNTRVVAESTKIYDRTGQHLLYDVHGDEKRTIIPLNQIPDNLK